MKSRRACGSSRVMRRLGANAPCKKDVLVFTAGVGENSADVREKTCEGLAYLGLQLDTTKNNAHPVDSNIAVSDSPPILVIQTQEDWAIAQLASNLI